jgi:SAM-dependent methyltransferase
MDFINSSSDRGEQRDSAGRRYRQQRISHWDRVSSQKENPQRPGAFYHRLLRHYFKFVVPPGARILELGCGHGDLLAALKPDCGVGVDFSPAMIGTAVLKHPHLNFIQADAHDLPLKGKFDIIILSDLVNDLWDVQHVFEQLQTLSHPSTRLVINFYNNLWRLPLSVAKSLGLGGDVLEQNWFAPNDLLNLLNLSGYEKIQHRAHILFPFSFPLIATLLNRFCVHFPPLSWFALSHIVVSRPAPDPDFRAASGSTSGAQTVSVIIPARNEAGNIEPILERLNGLDPEPEIIFVEGLSRDDTYEAIQKAMTRFPEKNIKLFQQNGRGKGDAVRLGFTEASGDILMILDADMTVPPEDLKRFYRAICCGGGEFINGVRLVYPLENQAMRFLNLLGNKFFSLAFSWLLGQPIKDTLCGTKVLHKTNYELIRKNRSYFGNFDPFGDFDLLFGAAKLNLKIVEMPIRYRSRTYGDTNISRWRHFWLLLRMVVFAALRIKFI